MYKPYLEFPELNLIEGGFSPSMIKTMDTQIFKYWVRSLYQRACSTIKYVGSFPIEENVLQFLNWSLFTRGYVAYFNTVEYGTVFNPCTLSGYNFYYQPTRVLVTNPNLTATEFEIGKDCELLRLTPDYAGVFDTIFYYAEKLSSLDNAINTGIINSKFAFIVGAKNKNTAVGIKKIFDAINRGEPLTVADKNFFIDDMGNENIYVWDRHIKESYITTDQLRDFQSILNDFDSEVGIPTIPYEKKERMVESEADSRKIDSVARSNVWFDCLMKSAEKVNDHFGIDLRWELRFSQEEERNERKDNPDGY